MILQIIIPILIGLIVGYNIGYRQGKADGIKLGIKKTPLLLLEKSLEKGYCILCSHKKLL